MLTHKDWAEIDREAEQGKELPCHPEGQWLTGSLLIPIDTSVDSFAEYYDAQRKVAAARIRQLEADRDAAYRRGLEDAAKVAEDTANVRCDKCGHPRNNHPYRHPFVSSMTANIPAAIRALAK